MGWRTLSKSSVIDMRKDTDNWLKIANKELIAAEALFKEEVYLSVIEHCHAALEKLLKGIITEQKGIQPPKIHSLLKLTSLTLIQNIEDDITRFLRELDASFISVRYPDDLEKVELKFQKEKTEQILEKVRDIYKWLRKQIN